MSDYRFPEPGENQEENLGSVENSVDVRSISIAEYFENEDEMLDSYNEESDEVDASSILDMNEIEIETPASTEYSEEIDEASSESQETNQLNDVEILFDDDEENPIRDSQAADLIGVDEESEPKNHDEISEEQGEDDEDLDFRLPKNLKIYFVIGIAVIILLALGIKLLFSHGKKEYKDSTQSEISEENTVESGMNEYMIDTISVSKDVYSCYIIPKKRLEIVGNNAQLTVVGMTPNDEYEIKLNVDSVTYNNISNSDLIEVQYKLMKVNGIIYTTDVTIKKVVHQ